MKKLLFVLTLSLTLMACGDKDPAPGAPGFSGMPDANTMNDMMKGPTKIRLTDELMESYVAMVKELKDIDTPGEAMLAKYNFNVAKWLQVSQVVGMSVMRAGMSKSNEGAQKRLDEAKAKLAKAKTDQEKQMLRAQITAYEAQLNAMSSYGEANENDQHNYEMYLRWKDRLEAAGGGRPKRRR